VLGQAQSPWRRFLSVAALVAAALAVPALGVAGSTPSAGSLRAQDRAIEAKSRAASLQLYALDHQRAAAQARLGVLQARAATLRAQRVFLSQQLGLARRSATRAQLHLAARLRALYEQGSVSEVEVVLGARSLDDAISRVDNMNRIARQDRAVLDQVEQTSTRLALTAQTLSHRAAELSAATSAAAATAASLVRAEASRSSYIASLANQRHLNEVQIASIIAQARAAELRATLLSREAHPVTNEPAAFVDPFPQSTVTPTVPPGGRLLTVTATGYSLQGRTATGLPVGWGIVAVDPSVIPLGTHMTVPGYGEAVAADIGGSVVGSRIDLWFPTVAAAYAWGRRTVTIVLH
jgi:3D (Asp-Asp-Asp) domain-containing protein